MECQHPEGPSKGNEYRNLCKACRKRALGQLTTRELFELKELAKEADRVLLAQLLEILPKLLHVEFAISKSLSDPSLTDHQKQGMRLLYQSIAFAISSIQRFEINETLNERARRS